MVWMAIVNVNNQIWPLLYKIVEKNVLVGLLIERHFDYKTIIQVREENTKREKERKT